MGSPTLSGRGAASPDRATGAAIDRGRRAIVLGTGSAATIGLRLTGPAGPAGQAPPDPYKMGIPPQRGRQVRHRCWTAQPCRGGALPRPTAPPARQSIVADTSRTTRSADQQSGPLHDRPAVNSRAQSPSRLKPATIWRPSVAARPRPVQPPSGGLRIQPGASAPGVRCRPPRQRWSRHHCTPRRRSAGPAGRRVRHRLPSTGRGRWHRLRASVRRTGDALTCPCRGTRHLAHRAGNPGTGCALCSRGTRNGPAAGRVAASTP